MVWGLIESVPYPKPNESSTPERRLRGALCSICFYWVITQNQTVRKSNIIRRSRQVSPENIIKVGFGLKEVGTTIAFISDRW